VLFLVAACAGRAPAHDALALYRSGRMHEARDVLRAERARSADDAARNAILLARVDIDLRVVWDAASFDDALAALATAHPRDPRLVAEVEQATGEVLFWKRLAGGEGEWPQVDQRFERALALRTAAGDTRGVAESSFYRGLIAQFTATPDEARHWFERALAVGRTVDDPLLQSYPVRHLADLAETAGDLARAETLHREALTLRERAGDVLRLFNARITLATFLCERMRRCDEAAPQLEAARRTADALRMPHGAIEVVVIDAAIAEWRGDLPGRDRAWQLALARADAIGDRELASAVHVARAAARLRQRDAAGALADARAVDSRDGHALVVEAALLAGDVDTAQAALAAAWRDPATPSSRMYLAAAAWLATQPARGQAITDLATHTGLPLDARAWRTAALETATRDNDLRARLDALVALGDREHLDEARRLAASAHLPLALPATN
jgi:hypothetical protein